jgi:Core-2/I-Branching enzyme
MRLLFLILAHDRPEEAAELARSLVAAASDGTALIHYDARSPAREFEALAAAVAGAPRIALVEKRVACPWGSFGLVEAPLNALAEVEARGPMPDYVVLLSGACLPCRPIASLERYLSEHAGREFIESEDERWVGNGWRAERWRYRFWFDHKTQRPAEWAFFHAQRLLGIERRFPDGLTPRFGSQWWTLSWPLCEAILADIRRSPARLDFFRAVWIPDEMVFQTYVHALVPPAAITGFGLTHFQFSNRGRPVVFHDDHLDYVRGLDRFFFRKAGPGAARLRADCLARAAAPDDGAPLLEVGRRRVDYLAKTAAQTDHPVAGQLFYRDQHVDMTDSVLARAEAPYVAVIGPPALTRAVVDRLAGPDFTALGEIFAPGEVDLGRGRSDLGGLQRNDVAIRDAHPAQFLTRLRARCDGVPVIAWSPLDAAELLEAVLRDPRALKIACLPFSGDEAADALSLGLACLVEARYPALPPVPMPGILPQAATRAQIDALTKAKGGWVHWLGAALLYRSHAEKGARLLDAATLCLPWQPVADPQAARQGLGFLEAAAGRCRFRIFPWFSEVAAAVHDLAEAFARAGTPPMLAAAAAGDPPAAEPAPEPAMLISRGRA